MKQRYILLLLIIILGLIAWLGDMTMGLFSASPALAADARPASLTLPPLPPRPNPQVEVRQVGDFEITMTTHPQQSDLTDVSVKNLTTGQVEFTLTLTDVYTRHIRPAEYYPGHLYIVRRVGFDSYEDTDWADELWRYDAQGRGVKLYSGLGTSFRVAPNENIIAAESASVLLAFVNRQGRILQEFNLEQLSGRRPGEFYADISVLKWSDDSRQFWGSLSITTKLLMLYRVEIGTWQNHLADVAKLPVLAGFESDLNPNTGQLVYSDYPALIAVDEIEEFEKSDQAVTLFVYDINTHKVRKIATATARTFQPKWLDNSTIEYNNPTGNGRIVYNLEDGP